MEPADTPQNVAIVGGGPGGMEAARIATLRGHQATIFERTGELGGAILLCCVGNDHDADLGGCWEYIKHYAEANKKQPIDAAMIVLNRVCKAVALVLEAAEELGNVDATPESMVAA